MPRSRSLCGPFFILAGTMHFVAPNFYRRIMPPYIPAHDAMIAASGVAEIAGGVGMLLPTTRRHAGNLLVATMLGVFPANIYMAANPEQFSNIPRLALYARLPLQGVFIAWILETMRYGTSDPALAAPASAPPAPAPAPPAPAAPAAPAA